MKKKYITVKEIADDQLCCCCGTCVTVCPVNAIQMTESPSGLLVPTVEQDKCNECGLCAKICPGLDPCKTSIQNFEDVFTGHIKSTYCGYANNDKTRKEAQSGGAVTEILSYLLQTKQVDRVLVSVMPEDGSLRPKPLLTNKVEIVKSACGSKYCPIAVNEVISKIEPNEKIAMVGLPCHFHGIENLRLKGKIKFDLFKIGLLCDRVLTFNAIDYLIFKCSEEPEDIKTLRFRSKEISGWPGDVMIKKKDNNKIFKDASYRMAAKEYFTPYRCRLCFDKMNILADISVGDPHGIYRGKRGQSVIYTRTDRADRIINGIRSDDLLTLNLVDTETALAGQVVPQKKQNYSGFMEIAKKQNLPFPEPVFESEGLLDSQKTKLLNHSFAMGSKRTNADTIKSANKQIIFNQLKRKYSFSNIIRKLSEILGKNI